MHDLRQKDIIEKVPPGTPITHLSNIHLVPKDNDPHGAPFTVDLRQLNKSIKREHHIMPTFEEMCDDLQNAKYFCKADMNHGNFQIELDENSRNLTCFSTHEGIHRFKRLTQGCPASGDAFQYIIAENICSGLKGVKNNQNIFFSMPLLKSKCSNAFKLFSNDVNRKVSPSNGQNVSLCYLRLSILAELSLEMGFPLTRPKWKQFKPSQ